MIRVAIAFHSGYGHTRRIAESIRDGAAAVGGVTATLIDVEQLAEPQWAELDAADAIVFGSPTYMGGASAQFKRFAESSSKTWLSQRWKDKVAGGFTCSMNIEGDKSGTLSYFVTLAMQHSMIWVGVGMLGSSSPGHPDEMNRLGASLGVMAQADNVPPDLSPPPGDIDTARAYGQRIAEIARRLRR